eukprot:c15490_g1_i1 orf=561-1751(-)
MSEDSIAWGRAEAGASLPPHKRLLAGFKKKGWSPSSSPSSAGPFESTHTTVSSFARLEDNPSSASLVEVHRKDDVYTGSLVKLENSFESTSMAKVEERGEDNLDSGSIVKLDSSLDSSSMVKLEEHDDGFVEHGDRECASFASESMDLYHRKSKRLRALPVDITKKSKKKVSKAVSTDHFKQQKSEPPQAFPGVVTKKMKKKVVSAEENLQSEGFSITDTDKDVDASAVVVEASVDTEKMAPSSIEHAERDTIAAGKAEEVKEGGTLPAAVRTINEESGEDTRAACAGDLKPGLSTCSKAKGGESVRCEVSWNHRSKVREEDGKPRRNHSRKHHQRIKETDQNRQEVQTGRSSQTPLPLSDEELALQLHRIMNSSPRISRRLSYKEDGPLLYPKSN